MQFNFTNHQSDIEFLNLMKAIANLVVTVVSRLFIIERQSIENL